MVLKKFQMLVYYRKGGTTPHLRLALSEEPSSRLALELVITTLTSDFVNIDQVGIDKVGIDEVGS